MNRIAVEPGYESLAAVLDEALAQAQSGKGKERHAEENEPFEKQVICEVGRRAGHGYVRGQAVKKTYESKRLPGEAGVRELLGAINYLAAAVILRREKAGAVHGGIVGEAGPEVAEAKTIGKLRVEIGGDCSGLKSAIQEAREELDGLKAEADEVLGGPVSCDGCEAQCVFPECAFGRASAYPGGTTVVVTIPR